MSEAGRSWSITVQGTVEAARPAESFCGMLGWKLCSNEGDGKQGKSGGK